MYVINFYNGNIYRTKIWHQIGVNKSTAIGMEGKNKPKWKEIYIPKLWSKNTFSPHLDIYCKRMVLSGLVKVFSISEPVLFPIILVVVVFFLKHSVQFYQLRWIESLSKYFLGFEQLLIHNSKLIQSNIQDEFFP